jgi:putative pyruvate formate lyase activating enzyme
VLWRPSATSSLSREMHRQVGDLVIDSHGIARRGLLLRHLIMPGQFQETRAILEWVATELGPNTYVNLVDQYRPAWKVAGDQYKEIGRPIATEEFAKAERFARDLGLRLEHRNPASGV